MKLPDTFISCDWGTSRLRLRRTDSSSGQILANFESDLGIKVCYENFTKQSELDQKAFYTNVLTAELEKAGMDLSGDTLIVASGMISSTLGLEELKYATLPLSFDGESLICKNLQMDERRNLFLISGVRSESDVMRGEETQAIGLAEFLPENGKGILLLPGTHSKHVIFDSGQFTAIQSFITGELFDLLVHKSTLQGALLSTDWNLTLEGSFLKGVEKGINNQLASSMFPIRATHLLGISQPANNYYYLSGLLIGEELSYLSHDDKTIYVVATGSLSELYRHALESFLPLDRIVRFDAGLVEKALISGQIKILNAYVRQKNTLERE